MLVDIQEVNLALAAIILEYINKHKQHFCNLDDCGTRSFDSFKINETS